MNIIIVAIASLTACIFMGLIKINIAIAIALCVVIAFIYADYLPHVKRYLKEYDAYFAGADKASEMNGLARIYLQEYKTCGLKRLYLWRFRLVSCTNVMRSAAL